MPLSLIHYPLDGWQRCSWCGQGESSLDYIHCHDHEWGMPVADDSRLFEKKITAQAAATLSQTPQATALSKTLKKMGLRFVGPTTMYALMQSMGVVNDHLEGCHHRAQAQATRAAFQRPV